MRFQMFDPIQLRIDRAEASNWLDVRSFTNLSIQVVNGGGLVFDSGKVALVRAVDPRAGADPTASKVDITTTGIISVDVADEAWVRLVSVPGGSSAGACVAYMYARSIAQGVA